MFMGGSASLIPVWAPCRSGIRRGKRARRSDIATQNRAMRCLERLCVYAGARLLSCRRRGGRAPPNPRISVQLVRLVPGRTLGFDAATLLSIERKTELTTQLVTSPT